MTEPAEDRMTIVDGLGLTTRRQAWSTENVDGVIEVRPAELT